MMTESHSLTILTLNVNGLNAPIRRHRMARWIQRQETLVCCIQETYVTFKDTHRLKRDGGKLTKETENRKKASVAILVSDKIDFK